MTDGDGQCVGVVPAGAAARRRLAQQLTQIVQHLGLAASFASGTAAALTFGWLVPMTAVCALARAAATAARSPNAGVAAGVAGSADLKKTIEFVAHRPDVDPTHIIAVGVSAGGFATVALTADPPPGLVAKKP